MTTIYSAIDDHIRLGLDAICKSCPARQSQDMIDACMQCTLQGQGLGKDDYTRRELPKDTRDYFV